MNILSLDFSSYFSSSLQHLHWFHLFHERFFFTYFSLQGGIYIVYLYVSCGGLCLVLYECTVLFVSYYWLFFGGLPLFLFYIIRHFMSLLCWITLSILVYCFCLLLWFFFFFYRFLYILLYFFHWRILLKIWFVVRSLCLLLQVHRMVPTFYSVDQPMKLNKVRDCKKINI